MYVLAEDVVILRSGGCGHHQCATIIYSQGAYQESAIRAIRELAGEDRYRALVDAGVIVEVP